MSLLFSQSTINIIFVAKSSRYRRQHAADKGAELFRPAPLFRACSCFCESAARGRRRGTGRVEGCFGGSACFRHELSSDSFIYLDGRGLRPPLAVLRAPALRPTPRAPRQRPPPARRESIPPRGRAALSALSALQSRPSRAPSAPLLSRRALRRPARRSPLL